MTCRYFAATTYRHWLTPLYRDIRHDDDEKGVKAFTGIRAAIRHTLPLYWPLDLKRRAGVFAASG